MVHATSSISTDLLARVPRDDDGLPARRSTIPEPRESAGADDSDEGFLQLGDGEDWPSHFGAARLGIP